jgi:hypothetical protein
MAHIPIFSGLPIPTPTDAQSLKGTGQLAFLVSQQWTANVSDDITGYYDGTRYIWMVNRIFASAAQR